MSTAPAALPRTTARARLAAAPATLWLAALVAVSFAVRLVVGAGHVAPRLFPDEYIYAALGRSLGEGSFAIRGEPAGFPALLEPLAAAPLWLLAGDDLELGYRLVQGLHALVVSLTAIPVYLLARRLGLGAGTALACGGLTLALPARARAPVVLAGAVARPNVGAAHVAPRLFPDEYIYAALGRSLGEGSFAIRGEPAGFPALLEPLAAAPLWLLAGDDLELGYRLVQGLHALVVSLTAIPVYLLARRLGLGAGTALACGGLTLALPALALAPFVMADAFALPFVVAAVAGGTIALDRPGWRPQLVFLGFAALATLARVQYVVLPLAFLAASLLVARGSVRQAARDTRVTLVLLAAVGLAALAGGPGRVLGYYEGVTSLSVDPVAIGRWLASDAFLVTFAAGWALVPLALVGLTAGAVAPRSRVELAFAGIAGAVVVLLLGEAAVYAANGAERFQERYLVGLLPLVPLLACLGARRLDGKAARHAVAALAAALFVGAAIVPLTGYAALTGKQDSPTLWAVAELSSRTDEGSAALLVGLCAGVLALLAAAVAFLPRLALPVTLAVSAAALVALGSGAVRYDATQSERTKLSFGDPDQSWIDHAALGDVAVLQTPFSSRVQISSQLFWNQSLTRILRMHDASAVDAYGDTPVRVDERGYVLADGARVEGPLLVEEYASRAELEDARLVRRTVNSALWDARGAPRLSLLLAGRYFDGLLGASATITVWPDADGRRQALLELPLSLPPELPAARIAVTAPGIERVIEVPPDATVMLRLRIDADGPWTASLRAERAFLASGGRLVAARAGVPRLTEVATTRDAGVKD